jgi:thiosulfate dehydrogenase [quinone] large subunit
MTAKSVTVLKGIKLYALVLLRMAIGWHFLFEGLSKLFTPAWSSADYLLLSNWIFAGFFHWLANNSGILSTVDFAVTWGLIIIGLTLFAGSSTG